MNQNHRIQAWKSEEEVAHIHGWDFSHLDGRLDEDTNFPWEFPDFSVDTHLEKLLNAQRVLDRNGCLEGRTHRFLLVAQKPVQ